MPPSMSSSSLQLISSKPASPPPSLSSSSSSSLSSIAATHSPFSECRCRLVLHLHPSHLANLMDGIHTHLNTYLLTHQPQLSHPTPSSTTAATTTTTSSTTVVLAYSNITLLSTTASIFYDRPYLNFPIALTLTTLTLTAGTTHYGRVSKVSADHVTLLVYGVFHCVVGRGEIPAWYEFGVVEGKGGRRQEVMADTRRGAIEGWQPKSKSGLAAAASAAGAGEDGQLNKKQAAKQQKKLEKEERRQAFLRSQQPTTTTTPTTTSTDEDSTDPLDYAVRVGSLVRFVVLSTAANDSFFAMAGSLTAEGAAVVAGDVVVPAEWKAKEEAEDEERRRKEEEEATSVEKLFAGEEEETAVDALSTSATDTLDGTTAHVSKKQLKAQKKLDKANRKAAKALRKSQQQQQQYTQPAAAAQQGGGATVTLHDKAEAMWRREKEEEAEELGRRREEDNQVNSVFVEEVFSHVDEHIIGGEGEEEAAGEGEEGVKERRKRGRDEAKGVKGGEDREKKKKRKSTKGES